MTLTPHPLCARRAPSSGNNHKHPHRFTSHFLLLLLLLSHFSRVRLCRPCRRQPTRLRRPWQEHWSGLQLPSPMQESEKWKKSLSSVRLLATPWTTAHQAPPSMGFSRQEYWSGVPLPSPSHLLGCYKPNGVIKKNSGSACITFRNIKSCFCLFSRY